MDSKFYDQNRPEDDFKITIDRNGDWHHDGQIITRDALTKLFATALYYDENNNDYWLITPHEQGRIKVADTPFIVTDFDWDAGDLKLISNLGHTVKPNKAHPIFLRNGLPYCRLDRNIPARLNRQVREKLIDIALSQNGYNINEQTLYLKANGYDHPVANA